MRITLNGQPKEFSQTLSLREIIDQVGTPNRRLIAEVNGDIVNNSQWEARTLQDGDRVELVGLVGGG